MMEKEQKAVRQYISEVLRTITPDSLKQDIAKEIRCHLAERIQEGIEFGLSEEQATASAIKRMGEASELGRTLAEIHRPRLNIWLITPTIVLLTLGWVAMYSTGRLGGQLLFGLIGLVLGGCLTFLDYSKLKRLASPVFCTVAITVVLAVFFGPKYAGQPYIFLGPLKIKLMDACPFLFIVALAGMVSRKKWKQPKDAVILMGASLLAQGLFFVTYSLPSLIMFVVAISAVMYFSEAKYWQIYLVGFAGVALTLLLHNPTAFVSSETFSSVQTAESHTDYVLTYLLETFGRSVAALVLLATLFLWVQLLDVIRGIKAETPRLVVIGIAALIGSEFAWSTLANLGWAPMPVVGLNYPLVSFGGTLLVVHLASIGLALSAYRRRTLRVI